MKKLTICLLPLFCNASEVPEGFGDFYEAKESIVSMEIGGKSLNVASKISLSYFQVNPTEQDKIVEAIRETVGIENALKIASKLMSGIDVPDECQYLDRICKTAPSEITPIVNIYQKGVAIYLGSDYYQKNNSESVEYVDITPTDLSLVTQYQIYQNSSFGDYESSSFNADVKNTLSMGDRFFKFDTYTNNEETRVENAYVGMHRSSYTFGGGYLDISDLDESSSMSTISDNSVNGYAAFFNKDPKLKKAKRLYGTKTIYSPNSGASLVVSRDDKIIYQTQLESGNNVISLSQFPEGRYDAEYVISIDGKVYDSYTELVVNTSSIYAVGEHSYGLLGYMYEPEDYMENQESSFVGRLTLGKRLTETISLYGVIYSDLDKTIWSSRADYFYDNETSLGGEVSLLNQEIAAYSLSANFFKNLRITYSSYKQDSDSLSGFASELMNTDSDYFSVSYSHSVFDTFLNYSIGSNKEEDNEFRFATVSASRSFGDIRTSLSLRGEDSDSYDKTNYSASISVNIPLFGGIMSAGLTSYDSRSTYYSEYSHSLYSGEKLNANYSAGYRGNSENDNEAYGSINTNINTSYLKGNVYGSYTQTSQNVNGSLNGGIVLTRSNAFPLGDVYRSQSYIVVDGYHVNRDEVEYSLMSDDRVIRQDDVFDNTAIKVNNYSEYSLSLNSKDENIVLKTPTNFNLTTGRNSVFRVKPSYNKAYFFSGFTKEKDLSCVTCLSFDVDENGFLFGKAISDSAVRIKTGKKPCVTFNYTHTDYVQNIGELTCKK